MNRSANSLLTFCCALLMSPGVAVLLAGDIGAPASRPNILFILADDLGWMDVGYHGSEIRTPHLDKLATGGACLNQFYVQPICSPTRAALLTGRYPMRYGMQVGLVRPWARYGLPHEERLLSQALKAAGYTTAIVGKWHLGHMSPADLPSNRGFDHQYGLLNGACDYYTHQVRGGHDLSRDGLPVREEGYTTDLFANEAVRLIEGHDFSRPLFMYLAFNAPHGPVKGADGVVQAPPRYVEQYKKIPKEGRRIHAAMVTCMDDAIGRVLAALERRGVREQTLIVFSSDNGGVNEGKPPTVPLRGEKNKLYEGGVRVPALVHWPKHIKPGIVVDVHLHIVDMYPTIVKLAGGSLEQPLPLDGKDAWPAITENAPSPHECILINAAPFTGAIRRGDWKLVCNGQLPGSSYDGPPVSEKRYELFNLRQDPNEMHDLSEKYPDILAELRNRLEIYNQQAVPVRMNPNQPPGGVGRWKAPPVWGVFDSTQPCSEIAP